MANLSLAELRRKQQVEPPTGQPARNSAFDEAESGVVFPGVAAQVHIGLPPQPSSLLAGRGYIRIFPPTFPSIADIPDDWKAQFWTSSSPWCAVEGEPFHPEFEQNLDVIEKTRTE